jgi:transposase
VRGQSDPQNLIFFSFDAEERVPKDHPLREIKRRADAILRGMDRELDAAYPKAGRPSVPPEQMLKALLLRALYSIPSEIKLMEAVEFNFLYRWFLDMPMDARAWTPEAFSMNRGRFESHGLVRAFFERVVAMAIQEDFASCDHFTIDGTLIRSWASHKSLVAREKKDEPRGGDDDPGNPSVDWRGERRTNDTHVSRTDPQARLYRKSRGKEAHLSHSGHILMENRSGLIVDMEVDAADGRCERRAALAMVERARRRHRLAMKTVGMDAGYDDGAFLHEMEKKLRIVPHVPVRRGPIVAKGPSADARRKARRRRRTKGFALSQRIRKRVEEAIGWTKTVAGLARTRFVGRWKIAQDALLAGAAYNLLRMRNMAAA